MNDRNQAAARLLADKLGMELPVELIAAALSQLGGAAAATEASPAAQPSPPDAAVDTRFDAGRAAPRQRHEDELTWPSCARPTSASPRCPISPTRRATS